MLMWASTGGYIRFDHHFPGGLRTMLSTQCFWTNTHPHRTVRYNLVDCCALCRYPQVLCTVWFLSIMILCNLEASITRYMDVCKPQYRKVSEAYGELFMVWHKRNSLKIKCLWGALRSCQWSTIKTSLNLRHSQEIMRKGLRLIPTNYVWMHD